MCLILNNNKMRKKELKFFYFFFKKSLRPFLCTNSFSFCLTFWHYLDRTVVLNCKIRSIFSKQFLLTLFITFHTFCRQMVVGKTSFTKRHSLIVVDKTSILIFPLSLGFVCKMLFANGS